MHILGVRVLYDFSVCIVQYTNIQIDTYTWHGVMNDVYLAPNVKQQQQKNVCIKKTLTLNQRII